MYPTLKKCCLAAACFTVLQNIAFAESTVYGKGNIPITIYQQKKINGTVSGTDGEKLPGVSIRIKGTGRGTLSGPDGTFSIILPDGPATLVFTYTGYVSQEVAVKDGSAIHVTLQTSTGELGEVVVVGYGQQKRTSLTGSVASLDQKALANRPITNASQALQGLPGVYVNQTKGRPGADGANIRIRGVGTLNNNNPLVLVDGIEFPLSDVNPSDIESITVLKDAASAAIYGNRAANGVVLVKTKSGKAGKFRLDYNGYTGVQEAVQLPSLVTNAVEYMEGKNRALANEGKPAEYVQSLIDEYKAGTDPYIYPNTDWFGIMFRNAKIQEHNLRFSGGNEKTTFSVSLGYLDQEGIMINSGAKKYSISSNVISDINPKLKIGANLLGTYWDSEESAYTSDESNGEGGLMGLIYRGLPMQTAYAKDGTYADQWVRVPGHNFFRNPLALAKEGFHQNATFRALASLFLEYQLPFGIRYKTTVAANLQYGREKFVNPLINLTNPKTGAIAPMGNIPARGITQTSRDGINLTNFHTLSYDKQLGKHHLGALAGFSVERFNDADFTASNQGYLGNEITELNGGSNTPAVNGKSSQSRLVSYFGRVNYDYNGKYLAEASFRYDGSSRFAAGKRWGFFPSLSAGWRISEEDFLKNNNTISNLKLRASWGRLGNQNIPLFSYVDAVSIGRNYSFSGTIVSGAAVSQVADPSVSWETTTITNAGLDIGLFKNTLTLEVDVFNKVTDDILRQINVPAQVGRLAGPYRNIGSVSNKGFEITAAYRNKIGELGYNLGANVAYLKNKVTDLAGAVYIDGNTIIREGAAIDAFYGLQAIGIFQSDAEIQNAPKQNAVTKPGDIKYLDADNNKVIDNNDRVIIGNSIPDYTYSFTLGLNYKGIELSGFFQGVKNTATYLTGNLAQPYKNGAGVTPEWLTDSWTPENPNARLPRLTTSNGYPQNFQTSSFWIQDASYLRLKNIQLSYDLPARWLKVAGIQQLKVFVNAQNWITFTDFKLGDPERNLTKGNVIDYPISKTATAGINLTL
ncbi:SusC/RagA family TonB-linked outer membrane protein [Chitinophaga sp. SYP-B3965]|uniref:SusC/RagA family TonB-linked outer membrane protein n=1 Tax=Chitinophaga sp. SYP-B3965 TaxID=2663120 RepID=UPI0012995DD9|nr:TonB-dependent receptor [Chitinophaga sp. SYP-B3965]MRG45523.1 SusC/RagA family TonB-linked outer membrane protein [Chitinophaga sp. SYP-B3965]